MTPPPKRNTSIQDVKRRHAEALMSLPDVLAVGVGRAPDGRDAVVVTVRRGGETHAGSLPNMLEGHPLVVQLTDKIRTT